MLALTHFLAFLLGFVACVLLVRWITWEDEKDRQAYEEWIRNSDRH